MRRNVRARQFRDQFLRLPANVRAIAAHAFRTFVDNPAHPGLQHHALKYNDRGSHRENSFSVRITAQYRAIYFVDGDTNVWYWCGSHAEYDTFTGVK